MNTRILFFSATSFLFAWAVHPVAATEVYWGAEEIGLGDASGAVLPPGNLVRLGTFLLADEKIEEHKEDIRYLDSHFVEFDSVGVGEGVRNASARWFQDSEGSAANLGIKGRRVFLWAFNSPEMDSATQHGIFTSSRDSWRFPADDEIPNTLSIDLQYADRIIVGGKGQGGVGGFPLVNLLPLPETPPVEGEPGATGWARSFEHDNDWFQSEWLGWFNARFDPWLYHQEHGWMYRSGDFETRSWLWATDLGWLWIDEDAYPWIHSASEGWLYYDRREGLASPGHRSIYRHATGSWELR